ncbi:hypothetical protein BraRD5C2_24100 [Bradyrhizobium sp. RD5-C2]|nr:hypothetical protein BraRD5C2_24100 [Bradyrhizobium sp. RD5-C2]
MSRYIPDMSVSTPILTGCASSACTGVSIALPTSNAIAAAVIARFFAMTILDAPAWDGMHVPAFFAFR